MTSTCSRGAITKRHVCGCAILHHLQHEFMWLCNSNSYWSHVSFETSLIQTVRSYRWPRHVWLSIANLTSWYAVLPVLFLSFLVFLFSAMLATYYKIFISVIRSNQQWSPVISFFLAKKKNKNRLSACAVGIVVVVDFQLSIPLRTIHSSAQAFCCPYIDAMNPFMSWSSSAF